MSISLTNCEEWSSEIFGQCDFNDQRLTARLKKIGKQLSMCIGSSLSASTRGNTADLEGSYRFIRNTKVTAEKIMEGGYKATIARAQGRTTLLSLEDTTMLSFKHSIKDELGDLGGPENSDSRGYIVHTALLVDGESEETLGLIEQNRWCRNPEERGKRHARKQRAYEKKESYKWQLSSEQIRARMLGLMPNVISVCDREADIYDYIDYKNAMNERFIVRASRDRVLLDTEEYKLFDKALIGNSLGTYDVKVMQKGGRAGRISTIEIRGSQVTFKGSTKTSEELTINIVAATEINPPRGVAPLQWFLLTSEEVDTFEDARQIARYYELRWRIEDFHKAWKTGAGVEKLRMQYTDNMEVMVVILAFLAVRLLQLKEAFEQEKLTDKETAPCCLVLRESEWKVLWHAIEKNKRLPSKPPSLGWAYKTIAKLGGWGDTKRTGKASWETIWHGWFRLQERVEGYEAAYLIRKKI